MRALRRRKTRRHSNRLVIFEQIWPPACALIEHRTRCRQEGQRRGQAVRGQPIRTLFQEITQCGGILSRHVAIVDCLGNGAASLFKQYLYLAYVRVDGCSFRCLIKSAGIGTARLRRRR